MNEGAKKSTSHIAYWLTALVLRLQEALIGINTLVLPKASMPSQTR